MDGGGELIEMTPGVNLEKEVLQQMEFKPIIRDVKLMDERIFRPEKMRIGP